MLTSNKVYLRIRKKFAYFYKSLLKQVKNSYKNKSLNFNTINSHLFPIKLFLKIIYLHHKMSLEAFDIQTFQNNYPE